MKDAYTPEEIVSDLRDTLDKLQECIDNPNASDLKECWNSVSEAIDKVESLRVLDKNAALTAEVAELKARVKEKTDLAFDRAELEIYYYLRGANRHDLAFHLQNTFETLTAEVAQLREDKDKLTSAMAWEVSERMRGEKELAQLRERARHFESEFDATNKEVAHLQKELAQVKAELEAERKIANPLFSLEIGDGSWVTTDSIAIIEKSKELGLFGHVSESKNPFSCGGVPLQRVHFSK